MSSHKPCLVNQMSLAGNERKPTELCRATRSDYPGRAGLLAGSQGGGTPPSARGSASQILQGIQDTHTHTQTLRHLHFSALIGKDFTPHVGGELNLWSQTDSHGQAPSEQKKLFQVSRNSRLSPRHSYLKVPLSSTVLFLLQRLKNS